MVHPLPFGPGNALHPRSNSPTFPHHLVIRAGRTSLGRQDYRRVECHHGMVDGQIRGLSRGDGEICRYEEDVADGRCGGGAAS